VDARMIGHAIEGFLRRETGLTGGSSKKSSNSSPKDSPRKKSSGWFGRSDEEDASDTCESSLCSTLKDLFVK
jgi:hypothetical protein